MDKKSFLVSVLDGVSILIVLAIGYRFLSGDLFAEIVDIFCGRKTVIYGGDLANVVLQCDLLRPFSYKGLSLVIGIFGFAWLICRIYRQAGRSWAIRAILLAVGSVSFLAGGYRIIMFLYYLNSSFVPVKDPFNRFIYSAGSEALLTFFGVVCMGMALWMHIKTRKVNAAN